MFTLTDKVSFTPDNVVDKFSKSINNNGYCGSIQASSFSCDGFDAQSAYLDQNSGQAVIKLNWDFSLVNTTLSCSFVYASKAY
jgi:hypothetical protein